MITHMLARYGDLGGLRDFAMEKGIELSDGDVRLAELAIFKKAYRLIKEGDYQSKLLPCALRVGPEVDGTLRIWHLEEMTGADVVATCPPIFWNDVLNFPDPESITFVEDRIHVDPSKRRHGQAHADSVLRKGVRRGRLHQGRVQRASGPREDRGRVLGRDQRDGRVREQLSCGLVAYLTGLVGSVWRALRRACRLLRSEAKHHRVSTCPPRPLPS